MSAEDLGRRLLREVEEDGLDEILYSLKALSHAAVSPYFGIQALDSLLPICEQGVIPQAQPQPPMEPWLSSAAARPLPDVSARNIISKGPFIEFISAGSGGGKTHLLYYMTTLATLPRTHRGIMLNGKDSAVVVLDTDCRFDIQRLTEVMSHYVIAQLESSFSLSQPVNGAQFSTGKSKVIHDLIQSSLSHIHIFRPWSHVSLLSTVSSLPMYLFHSTSHASISRPLHSIMLDSASAFFWQTRTEEDTARLSESRALSTNEVYATLARQLTDLSRTFSCAIITTSWSLSSTSHTAQGAQSMRSSLTSSWSLLPALRFGVRRIPVTAFHEAMSIEDALAEKGRRASAINVGKFEAWKLGSSSRERLGFIITKAGVNMGVEREDM